MEVDDVVWNYNFILTGLIVLAVCYSVTITAQAQSTCHENQANSTYLLCKILSGNGSNLIQITKNGSTHKLLWNSTNYCADWDGTFIDCIGSDTITRLGIEYTETSMINTTFTEEIDFSMFCDFTYTLI